MSATAQTPFANVSTRYPRLVNTLLVVALGWALAVLTLKLLPTPVDIDTSPLSLENAPVSAGTDPLAFGNDIAAAHLFGDAATKPAEKRREVKQPPVETKLNLQLAGVLAYEPQEKAIAIISAGSSEQNAYGVGDKVSGETRLIRVHPSYVVLDNRGREEILRLPENVAPIALNSTPSNTAAMPASAADQQAYNEPVDLPSTPGALRDTLARNPSLLGRVVSAEPYQENGQLMGYRITPKQNPEILEAQGIVAGDVITRVNNIQLNSQKQGIRALRNAVKAESLEVVVLRDGVEVPLSISLAQ